MAKTKRKSNSEDDEPDGESLQETFEEEIRKPYYDVFYLDNFKLPYEKLDVSVIIPTYNRCPYPPETLKEYQNPLLWSVKTILMQKPLIKELILVDDNSGDNTKSFVDKIKKEATEKGIKFKYIKNTECLGPGMARNIGSKNSSAKYLMFVDDDVFLAPYAIVGAIYTFEKLEKKGVRVGAINLPTYYRSSIPTKLVSKKDIGSISFLHGTYKANKEAFPIEYLEAKGDDKFLDSELSILKPFSIMNLNTTCLCSKSVFEEVGGFSEQSIKRMEDRDFGCKLIDNGYSVYFVPDSKFQCVHGAYGLKTGVKFRGSDWFKRIDKSISLRKAMDICDNPQENNGARVDHIEYIYQSILSFFTLAYLRNKKGATNWIRRVYKEFVIGGSTEIFGNSNLPSPDENTRITMWRNAINEGLEFVKNKEEREIEKIGQMIKRLQDKSEQSEDILGMMGDL